MFLAGPIICVEDDEDDQYLLKLAFKTLGVSNELRFFGNGLDALMYLQTTRDHPFIVLCDINMPQMNGIELRQKINADPYLRTKAIPFIFLTTADDTKLINIAYAADVQGYYKKPDEIGKLVNQLRIIVDYWQTCLHPSL